MSKIFSFLQSEKVQVHHSAIGHQNIHLTMIKQVSQKQSTNLAENVESNRISGSNRKKQQRILFIRVLPPISSNLIALKFVMCKFLLHHFRPQLCTSSFMLTSQQTCVDIELMVRPLPPAKSIADYLQGQNKNSSRLLPNRIPLQNTSSTYIDLSLVSTKSN